ncbi:MAG: J domain-containing protein, partial [Geminicoccaceae bacterium]
MAAASDPRGYYAALGVDRTASAEDIKSAFRHRAKLLHPDGNAAAGDDEGFRQLVEAYEALRDPQHRVRYDAESLAHDRRGAEDRWDWEPSAAPTDSAERSPLPPAWPIPEWLEVLVHRFGPRPLLAASAAGVLLTVVAVASHRVGDRDRIIADLGRQLEAAQQRAATVPSPVPTNADLPPIYRSELRFPGRSTELDAATRGRLDAVTAEL